MEPQVYKGTTQGFIDRLTKRIRRVERDSDIGLKGILLMGFKVTNHRYFHKINSEIVDALGNQGDYSDARIFNMHNEDIAYLLVTDEKLPNAKQIVARVEESMPERRRPVSASASYWPRNGDPSAEAKQLYATLCGRVEAAEEQFPEEAETLRYQPA